MNALTANSALNGYDTEIGAVRIAEVTGKSIMSVSTPMGGEDALAAALRTAHDADVPGAGQVTESGSTMFLGLARDQFFVLTEDLGHWPEKRVAAALNGAGYVTDQSDSWVILRVSGADSRAALARICPIDLHASVFGRGSLARTSMEHLGAIIVAEGGDDFLVMSARSSAKSFLHAVTTSATNIN